MQLVLVPAFADNVYGNPKMQSVINCYDYKSHKHLDDKVATLTKNLLLGLYEFVEPESDNTAYLNLVADSIRNSKNTDISLISRRVLPDRPNRWLIGCKELVEFAEIAHAKWGPRSTQFSRINTPLDLLKGDIWDSIYNENGTNFVSFTQSLTINTLFAILDKSVSLLPGFDDRIIQGISGFNFIWDSVNGVFELTVNSTGKTYIKLPDGTIPDGTDTVSVSLDNYTLLRSNRFSEPNPTAPFYPLLDNSNWTNCKYGSLVESTIAYLQFLGIFDPNDPIYSNRWVQV